MEKPIIMHFHRKEDHTEFMKIASEDIMRDGDDIMISENNEAIVIEIVRIN